MLENERQRRWWFANHPEYSNSRKGRRKYANSEGRDDQETVSPESVDAYVDEALKHVRGTVAGLLKSFKRNFGTQAEDQQNKAKSAAPSSADQTSHARYPVSGLRKHSNEELRRMGIPTPEEQALVSDPHTFLDVAPYKRYLTSPVQSLRGLFTGTAKDAILYWRKGDDIFDRTTKGKVPVWSTIARRYWKNESMKEGASEKWSRKNVDRMNRGLAPQQTNPRTGELESRELHHHPVARRHGGRDFIEVWPEEHAELDRYRRLKR
jgi:hypothetical protein